MKIYWSRRTFEIKNLHEDANILVGVQYSQLYKIKILYDYYNARTLRYRTPDWRLYIKIYYYSDDDGDIRIRIYDNNILYINNITIY